MPHVLQEIPTLSGTPNFLGLCLLTGLFPWISVTALSQACFIIFAQLIHGYKMKPMLIGISSLPVSIYIDSVNRDSALISSIRYCTCDQLLSLSAIIDQFIQAPTAKFLFWHRVINQ